MANYTVIYRATEGRGIKRVIVEAEDGGEAVRFVQHGSIDHAGYDAQWYPMEQLIDVYEFTGTVV